MKNMKRFIGVLLAVLMVGTLLAGCNKSSSTSAKKTIVVFSIATLTAAQQNEFFGNFEKQNNANIKYVTYDSQDFVKDFSVAINGGAQVDALLLNGQDVRSFVNKGLLTNLTDIVKYTDRFIDGGVNQYTYDGKFYALPDGGGSSSGVFYNKDILDKYSIQPPKTYDDLVADTKILNKNGLSTFAFGGGGIYMWPMWFMDAFDQATGGKAVDDTVSSLEGKMKFTDPQYVQAMKMIGEIGTGNMFQTGFNGADSATGEATFEAGKAAFFFGGTWEISTFTKGGLKNLGIVPFPVMVSGAQTAQCGCLGNGAALYSKAPAANKDLDEKLLDYMTNDTQQKWLNTLNGDAFSSNKNVKLDHGTQQPLYDIISTGLLPSTFGFLDWIWPPEVNQAFQQQLQAVAGGKTTPEKAMAAVQSAYDTLVSGGYVFGK